MLRSAIIISLLLTFPVFLKAQSNNYSCPFVTSPLNVDGHDSEDIWKAVSPTWFIPNQSKTLRERTWFKAAWDNTYLYFYIYLEDQQIECQMTNRDDHLWHEEVIEIFLDVDANPKTYFEFEWNARNTLLDLYVLNKHYNRDVIRQWWSWDCQGIQSAVRIDGSLNDDSDKDTGWAIEIAIPFEELYPAANIPPKKGDQWRMNLTRREGTETKGNLQKSSWLPPSCHFPLSYGTLTFTK
jgi:hypothetical protein